MISKSISNFRILQQKGLLEAFIWIVALLALAFTNPTSDSHYSLCLFKSLGISFCPGCGIGHSISYLFHGQFSQSFHSHPLGLLAIIVLTYRIISILKSFINPIKPNYHE